MQGFLKEEGIWWVLYGIRQDSLRLRAVGSNDNTDILGIGSFVFFDDGSDITDNL